MNDGDLEAKILILSAKQKAFDDLKREADALRDEIIAELRRRRIDRYDTNADLAAVLVKSERLDIPVPAFRAACAHALLAVHEVEAAIKQTVSVRDARALLGDDTVARIGQRGKPTYRLCIVSNRRARASA